MAGAFASCASWLQRWSGLNYKASKAIKFFDLSNETMLGFGGIQIEKTQDFNHLKPYLGKGDTAYEFKNRFDISWERE